MFSRVFCALHLLAFGQDVQLSMAAVQASGSPCSQPDWSSISLNENVSVPKPGSGQALVRVFGSSVIPVNVDLVEPICEGFGCSARTIGTDMAGVVVAVGEDCDLMYGSEVWGIVQGAYAQYALATCSEGVNTTCLLSPPRHVHQSLLCIDDDCVKETSSDVPSYRADGEVLSREPLTLPLSRRGESQACFTKRTKVR